MQATSPLQIRFAPLVATERDLAARASQRQAPAITQPLSAPPQLQAVPRDIAKKRSNPVVGAVLAVAVILGVFAVKLALSLLVSQGAYEMRALNVEKRDLGRVERVVAQNLDKLSSPQNLAENAAALGMLQNVQPATMRLSDGIIQGSQSNTVAAGKNLVPNSQLSDMPILNSAGLRDTRAPVLASVASDPVYKKWTGKLPVPQTH